jgi:hypothetical protein
MGLKSTKSEEERRSECIQSQGNYVSGSLPP